MSRRVSVWLPVVFALSAPLAVVAQEGDPYTIQAINNTNGGLKAQWMDLRVEQIEVLSVDQGRASARVHKQPFHWVADDDRRAADGDHLTYLVQQADSSIASGVASRDAEGAIDRAVATWAADSCLGSTALVKRPDTGADADIFDAQFGYGGGGKRRAPPRGV